MKLKRAICSLCVASLIMSMSVLPVFAVEESAANGDNDLNIIANESVESESVAVKGETVELESEVDTDTGISAEEKALQEGIDLLSVDELSRTFENHDEELDVVLPDLSELLAMENETVSTSELHAAEIITPDVDEATLIGEVNTNGRSADSVTQQFTDYLTTDGDQKYVTFNMGKDQIVNLTLECPANDNLDYQLLLAAVLDDGSLNAVGVSALGTYVDPETGKTVDEGISYIHTEDNIATYAAFVVSDAGSSTTESFTLTISLDAAGSYDSYEPNDSPFTAVDIVAGEITASLHVPNDQDWYAFKPDKTGMYLLNAGANIADAYYAAPGNQMKLASQYGKYFRLEKGITYYIKVYSYTTMDKFKFGDYTFKLEYRTRYETEDTAFNYGAWEHANMMIPDIIPPGQQIAYYKFSMDPEDKAYVNFDIQSTDKYLLIIYDSKGEICNYGAINYPDFPDRGIISNKRGLSLVADIDGNRVGATGQIVVIKGDISTVFAYPYIDRRILSGSGTFAFSGSASNPGGSYSNILTLDLSNNSKIPPKAVVKSIDTKGNLSVNIMGVQHMLQPGTQGWLVAPSGMSEDGTFSVEDAGIEAKQQWQFRYYQSALKSSTMKDVKMTIYWNYDLSNTNYEFYQ